MFQSLFSSLTGVQEKKAGEEKKRQKKKNVLHADHCAFWSDGFDAFSDTLMAS